MGSLGCLVRKKGGIWNGRVFWENNLCWEWAGDVWTGLLYTVQYFGMSWVGKLSSV